MCHDKLAEPYCRGLARAGTARARLSTPPCRRHRRHRQGPEPASPL